MPEPNVITPAVAAQEKGCTTQAIRNAASRGDLNAVRMGTSVLIMRDKKYRAYQVQETGGRLHRDYQEKQEGAQ